MLVHGISHAMAAVTSALFANFIAEEIKVYLPTWAQWLDDLVHQWMALSSSTLSHQVVVSLVWIGFLAFWWGVVFRLLRSGL